MEEFNMSNFKMLPPLLWGLFPELSGGRWGEININEIAIDLVGLLGLDKLENNPFLDPYYCDRWKEFILKVKGLDYAYGGYMEDRSVVWHGHYMQPGHFLHLGVDYYVPVNTPVHLPTRAKLVYSLKDGDEAGGWGGMMIFQWLHGYFLMAHLKDIMEDVGKTYEQKDVVALIAEPARNGGWSPHLHLQCSPKDMTTVDGYWKHYDGIEQDFPNPDLLPW
jgi:hypothetical protein